MGAAGVGRVGVHSRVYALAFPVICPQHQALGRFRAPSHGVFPPAAELRAAPTHMVRPGAYEGRVRPGALRPLSNCQRFRRGTVRSTLPETLMRARSISSLSWFSPFLGSPPGSCRSSSQERVAAARGNQQLLEGEAAHEPQPNRRSGGIRALEVPGTTVDDASDTDPSMNVRTTACAGLATFRGLIIIRLMRRCIRWLPLARLRSRSGSLFVQNLCEQGYESCARMSQPLVAWRTR
jgi:hypothetical protein